jgi:pimeloyl-ACP methyl ester carboxylesterase
MNADANRSFAAEAKDRWRLEMPVLFVHAEYDVVCETMSSRLAEPMREWCTDLSEAIVQSGHWMAQEKPGEVNAAIAKWLAVKLPAAWTA